VYLEADDVGAAMMGIATSQEPFDVWFRERTQEIHGIDLAEPAPPAEAGCRHQGLDRTNPKYSQPQRVR
jgi:hypothetical protein